MRVHTPPSGSLFSPPPYPHKPPAGSGLPTRTTTEVGEAQGIPEEASEVSQVQARRKTLVLGPGPFDPSHPAPLVQAKHHHAHTHTTPPAPKVRSKSGPRPRVHVGPVLCEQPLQAPTNQKAASPRGLRDRLLIAQFVAILSITEFLPWLNPRVPGVAIQELGGFQAFVDHLGHLRAVSR